MKIEELNHVAIYVKDVEVSARFYRDILGLKSLPRPAFDFPGAWFRLGEFQELHLIGNRQKMISPYRPQHFALKITSAAEAEEQLNQKGVKFSRNRRPDGAVQLFLQDPDGYYIELFEFMGSSL